MDKEHINNILKEFNIEYNEDIRYKLNSLTMVSLIMQIEETFNVKIEDIDIKKNNTLENILDEFVNHK